MSVKIKSGCAQGRKETSSPSSCADDGSDMDITIIEVMPLGE